MKTNKTAVSTISIMATAVALMGAPVFASQDKADITRADALEMAGKPEGKPKHSPAERFEKLDTDADGVLSKDELSAGKGDHKGKTEDK